MSPIKRWYWVLAVALCLPGCSDSPTEPKIVPTTVTRSGSVSGHSAANQDFTAAGAGTATASVTFEGLFPALVVMYVTSTSCTVAQSAADNVAGSCTNIARVTGTARPKVATFSVEADTAYRVWIANYSGLNDTYTLTLTYPARAS